MSNKYKVLLAGLLSLIGLILLIRWSYSQGYLQVGEISEVKSPAFLAPCNPENDPLTQCSLTP